MTERASLHLPLSDAKRRDLGEVGAAKAATGGGIKKKRREHPRVGALINRKNASSADSAAQRPS